MTPTPLLSDLLASKPRRILIMYRRHRRTKMPFGCVVAIRDGESIKYGWSWCCKDDRPPCKKTAVKIAYLRAFILTDPLGALAYGNARMPRDLANVYHKLVQVAERRWLGRKSE